MFQGYHLTYLLMGLLFFIVWLGFYFYRKDTRKQMLVMSFVVALMGPVSDLIYTKDWWKPLTIFGSRVGLIEPLLVAFSIGGIMTVAYEDIFKKKIKLRRNRDKALNNRRLILIIFSGVFLMFTLYYLLGLNSFWAINLPLVYALIVMLFSRPDLLVEAVLNALTMLFIAIFIYNGLEFLTPGWVDTFWYWQNVPRIIFLNMPIDDVVNYLLIGAFVGVLYEYWQEGRLVSIR